MKKLLFILAILILNVLFADESNWISYDGWVTGPGSVDNKYTYLLPFGYKKGRYNPEDATIYWQIYFDNYPLLYETDMGWPVPDANETELKYLFFGDTYFFMRDQAGRIMSKISDGSDTLDFNVENNAAEIERIYDFSPSAGSNLNNICTNQCLFINPNATLKWCSDSCSNILNVPSYSDCFSACNELNSNHYVFNYIDSNIGSQEEICKKFCMFDMVDTYASSGYFLYDGSYFPEDQNEQIYNNGSSNIFLAADLHKNGSGNATKYNIKFHHPDREDSGSAQIYSTTDNTHRRSKSIWMNILERNFVSNVFVGIYPRGYFYACQGTAGNSGSCLQESKKLFVPYNVTTWDFFTPAVFGENLRKYLGLPDNAQFAIAGNDLDPVLNSELNNKINQLGLQKYDLNDAFQCLAQNIGVGIYDFENESRFQFSHENDNTNNCCENFPNKQILWPAFSKMSGGTVIHGLDRDILSPDDDKEYIYFMGTGETKIDTSLFYITRT